MSSLDATDTTLAASVRGDGTGVVVLHGFAQTRDCLGPMADELASGRRLVTPDAPGHGGSARHAAVGLARAAELLVSTGGRSAYVGYSMGARICLRAAVDHPERVRALVLVGGTPGIVDPAERAERRRADAELADRLERLGVDGFLEEWLAMPMFAGLPEWARFDRERRTNTAHGLASSLRHAGTGSMAPLWAGLDRLDLPVLCVAGSDDHRYADIAGRMARRIPGARVEVVQGAGHAAHLERPAAVAELIDTFLDEVGADGTA